MSSVNHNSLAASVGLQVGDQLTEINGINLRFIDYIIMNKVCLVAIAGAITLTAIAMEPLQSSDSKLV